MRAQSSIEFLYSAILMLGVFGIVSMVFLLSQSDVSAFSWHTEASSACRAASAQIASVASAGTGAHSRLELPQLSAPYALRLDATSRTATITGNGRIVSCPLTLSALSNGTSGNFDAQNGTMMQNNGEVVFFG